MSSHTFADSLGNSYLGLSNSRRYLLRYIYTGQHKIGLMHHFNKALFVLCFVSLALVYKAGKGINTVFSSGRNLLFATTTGFYLLVVALAVIYKINW